VRLDDRSASDFVRLYVGARGQARWAEPTLAADLLQDAAQTSRALFMLHARERRWAPVGLLRGAPGPILASLAGGLDLRCEQRVGAVSPAGTALRVDAAGAAFEADACVLAVPPHVALGCAAPLLSTAERALLARRSTGPSFTLSIALSRSLRERVLWVRLPGDAGLPIAGVLLEPSGERAPAPEGCELATVVARPDFALAQRDAPDDALEKALREALARVLPGADAALRFTRLWRQPEATPRFPVGVHRDVASFRAVQRDLRERGRRLYFAGAAWVTPTLEGAVASGLRAADELLGDLAVSANPR
jgi:protoporphyrinogen oxidase